MKKLYSIVFFVLISMALFSVDKTDTITLNFLNKALSPAGVSLHWDSSTGPLEKNFGNLTVGACSISQNFVISGMGNSIKDISCAVNGVWGGLTYAKITDTSDATVYQVSKINVGTAKFTGISAATATKTYQISFPENILGGSSNNVIKSGTPFSGASITVYVSYTS